MSAESTARYVLEVREASPLVAAQIPVARVALLGSGKFSAALAEELGAAGCDVVHLPGDADEATTLAQLAAACADRPLRHLILCTASDDTDWPPGADEQTWRRFRESHLTLPIRICQAWIEQLVESKETSQATLLAVTRLGGDYGLARPVERPDGGGLAGMLKALFVESLAREWGGPRIRVVDFAPDVAATSLAKRVAAEWADLSAEPVADSLSQAARTLARLEIGYVKSQRARLRLRAEPLAETQASSDLGRGPWIVTGGGRGITALVARAIAERFGLRLHVLGSSPLPDIDRAWCELPPAELDALRLRTMREAHARGEMPATAWDAVARLIEIARSLRAYADAGVAATYHRVDLARRSEVVETIARIRAWDGPIEGIIHGAGTETTARFERKSPAMIEATLAGKIDGAASLESACADEPPRFVLAFGSIVGRCGGIGQADYALANELLAKWTASLRGRWPDCRACTFHWPAWGEVGMAVRSSARWSLERHAVRFMPPGEGIEHVLRELGAGLPRTEVLIAHPTALAPLAEAMAEDDRCRDDSLVASTLRGQ